MMMRRRRRRCRPLHHQEKMLILIFHLLDIITDILQVDLRILLAGSAAVVLKVPQARNAATVVVIASHRAVATTTNHIPNFKPQLLLLVKRQRDKKTLQFLQVLHQYAVNLQKSIRVSVSVLSVDLIIGWCHHLIHQKVKRIIVQPSSYRH